MAIQGKYPIFSDETFLNRDVTWCFWDDRWAQYPIMGERKNVSAGPGMDKSFSFTVKLYTGGNCGTGPDTPTDGNANGQARESVHNTP